jgi:hypothetical protein
MNPNNFFTTNYPPAKAVGRFLFAGMLSAIRRKSASIHCPYEFKPLPLMQEYCVVIKHLTLVEIMKKWVKAFLLVVAALLLPSVAHAQTTAYTTLLLSYGPLAYWPMNEGSGVTAYDAADNPNATNNGTYYSENEQNDPALFVLGQPGPGYLFGTNTSVSLNPPAVAAIYGNEAMVAISNEPDLNGTGPVTIIAWMQDTDSGAFATLIGNTDQSYHMDVDQNGYAHFADGNGDGDTVAIGTSVVNDGAWHQLVGVYDGASNNIYVDGILENATPCPTAPLGNDPSVSGGDFLMIGDDPEYFAGQGYSGDICQLAVIPSALTAANVKALYNTQMIPACASWISHFPTGAPGDEPLTPVVYAGSLTLMASVEGSLPLSLQWYYIDASSLSNNIPGANSVTYTILAATPSLNGYQYGINAVNADGANTCGNQSVTLTVLDEIVLPSDLSPPTGEAYVGAPLTYTVFAGGDSLLLYQWLVDGVAVAAATNSTLTTSALCGQHTNQVNISSASGSATTSSSATYQGDPLPTNITFASTGWNSSDWTLNGTAGNYYSAQFSEGLLVLTDGGTEEVSSAFFGVPQYAGSFTASFIYQATGGEFGYVGTGVAFILQNAAAGTSAMGELSSLGTALGYYPITNSAAFEISLNALTLVPGIAFATNGETPSYGGGPPFELTGSVGLTNGDPILVQLTWANGNLAVTLTDQIIPSLTYSTNYDLGESLTPVLNGTDLAYIGFSGADGNSPLLESVQTVSNFTFTSTIPPVRLALSAITSNSFVLSWPVCNPADFVLEQATNLLGPWTLVSTEPTVAGGVNTLTRNYFGGSQMFYNLVRQVCPP